MPSEAIGLLLWPLCLVGAMGRIGAKRRVVVYYEPYTTSQLGYSAA